MNDDTGRRRRNDDGRGRRRVSGATPYFQEFLVVFKEMSLGMIVQKANNLVFVKQINTKSFTRRNVEGQRHGEPEQCEAARGGVTPGCFVVAVNKDTVLGPGYDTAVATVKASKERPMTLGFRRLHVVEDHTAAGYSRRYWQGYLRCKCGPQRWTGRFHILREDGSIQTYPGKDILFDPIETLTLHVHAKRGLRVLVNRDELAAEWSLDASRTERADDVFWKTVFGVDIVHQTAGDQQQSTVSTVFFRAEDEASKWDWVAALTSLSVMSELARGEGQNNIELEMATETSLGPEPRSPTSSPPLRPLPSPNNEQHAQPQARRQSISRHFRLPVVFHRNKSSDEDDELGGPGVKDGEGRDAYAQFKTSGETKARILRQGFLKKRGGSKLLHPESDAATRVQLRLQLWKRRWVVLRDDGRLVWYRSTPADASEVPTGHMPLHGAVVSWDPSEMAEHLGVDDDIVKEALQAETESRSDDDLSRVKYFPFVVRGDTRVLFLRTKSAAERADWAAAIAAVADPSGADSTRLFPSISTNVERAKQASLAAMLDNPGLVFEDPELAFSLMVNHSRGAGSYGGAGGVLREDFTAVAGQYFTALCDAFTAGAVFDALLLGQRSIAGQAVPSSQGSQHQHQRPSGGTAESAANFLRRQRDRDLTNHRLDGMRDAFHGLRTAVTEWVEDAVSARMGHHDSSERWADSKTRAIEAEPLPSGLKLTYEMFRRYVRAVEAVSKPVDAWEALRMRLNVDPLEVLLRADDSVGERTVGDVSSGSSTAGDDRDKGKTAALFPEGVFLSDSGSVYMTERYLYFSKTLSTVVRVIPLSSVVDVRETSTQVGGLFKIDDAVTLVGAKVFSINIAPEKSSSAGAVGSPGFAADSSHPSLDEQVRQRSSVKGSNYTLVFSKIKDVFTTKHKDEGSAGGRRRVWFECLSELVCAHRTAKLDAMRCSKGRSGGLRSLLGGNHLASLSAKLKHLRQEKIVNIERHRLPLWAGINVLRTQALLKATSRPVFSLLVCSNQISVQNRRLVFRFLHDDELHVAEERKASLAAVSDDGGDGDGGAAVVAAASAGSHGAGSWAEGLSKRHGGSQDATGQEVLQSSWSDPPSQQLHMAMGEDHTSAFSGGRRAAVSSFLSSPEYVVGEEEEWHMVHSRWLASLVHHLSHAASMEHRVELETGTFNPNRFRDEWHVFWDCVDPVIDLVADGSYDLVWWRRPMLSAAVFWVLLVVCYHDLVHHLVALVLVANAAFVLFIGYEHKRRREMREEEEEDDDEDETGGGGGHDREVGEGDENEGVIDQIKKIHAKFSNMQRKLHAYNTVLLKIKALYTWSDPVRTKWWVIFMFILAAVFVLVPARFVLLAVVVFAFATPIRPPEKTVPELLLDDFYIGIPVESATHMNFEMSSIYWSEKREQQATDGDQQTEL